MLCGVSFPRLVLEALSAADGRVMHKRKPPNLEILKPRLPVARNALEKLHLETEHERYVVYHRGSSDT